MVQGRGKSQASLKRDLDVLGKEIYNINLKIQQFQQ